jgi:hypothetical protein
MGRPTPPRCAGGCAHGWSPCPSLPFVVTPYCRGRRDRPPHVDPLSPGSTARRSRWFEWRSRPSRPSRRGLAAVSLPSRCRLAAVSLARTRVPRVGNGCHGCHGCHGCRGSADEADENRSAPPRDAAGRRGSADEADENRSAPPRGADDNEAFTETTKAFTKFRKSTEIWGRAGVYTHPDDPSDASTKLSAHRVRSTPCAIGRGIECHCHTIYFLVPL